MRLLCRAGWPERNHARLSRASSTVTSAPIRCRSPAAFRPATPAPSTITFRPAHRSAEEGVMRPACLLQQGQWGDVAKGRRAASTWAHQTPALPLAWRHRGRALATAACAGAARLPAHRRRLVGRAPGRGLSHTALPPQLRKRRGDMLGKLLQQPCAPYGGCNGVCSMWRVRAWQMRPCTQHHHYHQQQQQQQQQTCIRSSSSSSSSCAAASASSAVPSANAARASWERTASSASLRRPAGGREIAEAGPLSLLLISSAVNSQRRTPTRMQQGARPEQGRAAAAAPASLVTPCLNARVSPLCSAARGARPSLMAYLMPGCEEEGAGVAAGRHACRACPARSSSPTPPPIKKPAASPAARTCLAERGASISTHHHHLHQQAHGTSAAVPPPPPPSPFPGTRLAQGCADDAACRIGRVVVLAGTALVAGVAGSPEALQRGTPIGGVEGAGVHLQRGEGGGVSEGRGRGVGGSRGALPCLLLAAPCQLTARPSPPACSACQPGALASLQTHAKLRR